MSSQPASLSALPSVEGSPHPTAATPTERTGDQTLHVDPPLLTIAIEGEADNVLVQVAGEIDLTTAAQLRSALLSAVEGAPPPAAVHVDLADVSFIDATGVRVLVEAHEIAVRGGQALSVYDPSRIVARVLDILDLTDLLHVVVSPRRGSDAGPPTTEPSPPA